MPRISVIGTSGSGKTTLARNLARLHGITHIELDALNWGPNWTEVGREEFRRRVGAAVAADAWVACGNYGAVRDLVMARADTFVFLDYPMTVVFTRSLCRTLRRCWTKEELWNGNRERFLGQFFSSDSLLLWVIRSWRMHRRDYPKRMRQQAALGKRVIRFATPEQTDRWMKQQQSLIGLTPEAKIESEPAVNL